MMSTSKNTKLIDVGCGTREMSKLLWESVNYNADVYSVETKLSKNSEGIKKLKNIYK